MLLQHWAKRRCGSMAYNANTPKHTYNNFGTLTQMRSIFCANRKSRDIHWTEMSGGEITTNDNKSAAYWMNVSAPHWTNIQSIPWLPLERYCRMLMDNSTYWKIARINEDEWRWRREAAVFWPSKWPNDFPRCATFLRYRLLLLLPTP